MNQKGKKLLCLTAGMWSALMMTAASFAAESNSTAGIVTTSASPLTVRASASASSARRGSLEKGSAVTLLSQKGAWWYVEYGDGLYGYCSADYLRQLSDSYAAEVATSSGRLNVRSGASASSAVRTSLPKGETVVVLSSSSGWSKILYHGTKTGYVSSSYLKKAASSTAAGGRSARTLNVPSYKQYDSRWASMTVGNSGSTMKQIGCTVTALAMTESYRTGKTLTPASMLSRLSFTSGGAVYWPSNYTAYTGDAYLERIYSLLSQNTPVILGAKNASGKAHWVVVNRFSGGTLTASSFGIEDPGSTSRTTLADLFAEYPYFYKLEFADE